MVEKTSLMSYKDILGSGLINKRCEKIYSFLIDQNESFSDREIAYWLRYSDPNAIRPRRKDLVDMGLVMASNVRRCGVSGKTVKTWEALKNAPFKKIKQKNIVCPMCGGCGKLKSPQTNLANY